MLLGRGPSRLRTGLALACAAVALVVVVLGAYVRISNAGLSCPDWPLCYGQIGAPNSAEEILAADKKFPTRPVETAKAWKEMAHRYVAGTLGLLILALAIVSWRAGRRLRLLSIATLVLVVFQSALGMWTVTLLVKPVIVLSHLIGGMSILALLWLMFLAHGRFATHDTPQLKPWLLVALAAVFGQIALGGWVSSNYAALVCPSFPGCLPDQAWPSGMRFDLAMTIFSDAPRHQNYEYGTLPIDARIAIHMAHRVGAAVVVVLLGAITWRAYRRGPGLRVAAIAVALAISIQFLIGMTTVLLGQPPFIATAHNAGAALTVLALVFLMYRSSAQRR